MTGHGVIAALAVAAAALCLQQTPAPVFGTRADAVIIDAAMPAILLSLVYAAQFKLDAKFASTLVFTNFILALPTLFIVLWLTTNAR